MGKMSQANQKPVCVQFIQLDQITNRNGQRFSAQLFQQISLC